MSRKRRNQTWWTALLGPLFMGLVGGISLLNSLARKAIWRGPGLEPVIRQAERPSEYYTALFFFAFLTAVGLGGAIWMFIAVRRARRQAGR